MITNIPRTYKPNTPAPKVGSALTWVLPGNGLVDDQLSRVARWTTLVPRVYVLSETAPPKANGLFWINTNRRSLRDLIGFYLSRVPGREPVVIAPASVELGGDVSGLLEFVRKNRMELAWGSFSRPSASDTPIAFFMSAAVLPYVMQAAPDGLELYGNDWARWLHDNLGRTVTRPRYFDASSYGLATQPAPKQEAPVVNAYELPPEPKAEEPKEEVTILRKRGRPRKVKV